MANVKSSSTAPPSGTKTLNAKRLESENRRLRQKNEALKQRNRELDLISQSFLAINSSLELDRVLSKIEDYRVMHLLGEIWQILTDPHAVRAGFDRLLPSQLTIS